MITTRIQKTFSIVKENHTLFTSSGKDPFNRSDVSYFTWFFYRVTLGSVKSFTNTTIHSHTHTHTHTTRMHTHTHHTHAHTHTHTHTHAHRHTDIITHTHAHRHTHIITHTRTDRHTQTNTYADIYLLVVRERSIYL